jgi:hypothetical protein
VAGERQRVASHGLDRDDAPVDQDNQYDHGGGEGKEDVSLLSRIGQDRPSRSRDLETITR